jgi:hypothetical protein
MTTPATTPADGIEQQDARFAINGAIAYGRMGIKEPPAAHWLTEYWHIGRQLAKLGETSAWDNQTPLATTPASASLTDEQIDATWERTLRTDRFAHRKFARALLSLATPLPAEHEDDSKDFVNFYEAVARQEAEESGAVRVLPLYASPGKAEAEDAARYRWLAENAIVETAQWRNDGRDPASTKHVLDRAIDAAIQQKRDK